MPRDRRGAGPDVQSEQSEKRPAAKRGGRLLKVALLGGAVGLLVRDDVRARVLDVLFGAEEQFDYTSVTEPAVPGSDAVAAAAASDTVVASAWVGGGEEHVASPIDSAPADEPAGGARAVAPSPAAWAHVPEESEAEPSSEEPPADGASEAGEPPAPPSDWWTPDAGAGSATDS